MVAQCNNSTWPLSEGKYLHNMWHLVNESDGISHCFSIKKTTQRLQIRD